MLNLLFLLLVATAPLPPDEETPRALSVAAGLGFAFPERQNGRDVEGTGTGGYAQAEYIVELTRWFTPRLYAGLVFAPSDANCGATPCDVSARILFGGGKFRLMAPIPYVGPFFDLGLGISAGSISTRSGTAVSAQSDGVTYHVPFAIGLAIGNRHQFELAFQYLFHPAQKQACGALAAGVTFRL